MRKPVVAAVLVSAFFLTAYAVAYWFQRTIQCTDYAALIAYDVVRESGSPAPTRCGAISCYALDAKISRRRDFFNQTIAFGEWNSGLREHWQRYRLFKCSGSSSWNGVFYPLEMMEIMMRGHRIHRVD